MLKVIIFIIMVICAMLIWEKIFIFSNFCWKKLTVYRAGKAVDNQIKKERKRKEDLKKQFEAKGWRIAK